MEQILGGFSQLLISWGAPGLVIVLLYLDRNRVIGELAEARKTNSDTFEKRISESRETMTALSANTAALGALTDVVKDRRGN